MLIQNNILGYGIFATEDIQPQSFLLEYRGKLQDGDKGELALQRHHNNGCGSFVYFFKHDGKFLR